MPEAEADPRAGLPGHWPEPLIERIRRRGADRTVLVLDDDPTGTQTVRGVDVLIDPSADDLDALLAAATRLAFVLTNSRSLPPREAGALGRRLGELIAGASARTGRAVSVISRGDSTLRGHFPVEVETLAEGLGIPDAPILLMPYLGDAGRLTIADVHYVVREGLAVPVGETEFARDPAFGFSESDLRAWVAERLASAGSAARPTASASLELVRGGGPAAVAALLAGLPPRAVCVANAAEDRDAEVLAAAVIQVERAGRPLLARTAAGYVRARAGQERRPDLAAAELPVPPGPGLVVVGSHVPTTTRQLERLIGDPPAPMALVEIPAEAAASDTEAEQARAEAAATALALLAAGRIPVIATSRSLVVGGPDDPDGLRLARRVSAMLVGAAGEVVAAGAPAWLVAKGGITSSDVATRALGAKRATVLGQVVAGVPVWRVPGTSGQGAMTLVVFPGNVGDDRGLRDVVATLVAAGSVSA